MPWSKCCDERVRLNRRPSGPETTRIVQCEELCAILLADVQVQGRLFAIKLFRDPAEGSGLADQYTGSAACPTASFIAASPDVFGRLHVVHGTLRRPYCRSWDTYPSHRFE
jgi:hypothetical protein